MSYKSDPTRTLSIQDIVNALLQFIAEGKNLESGNQRTLPTLLWSLAKLRIELPRGLADDILDM